MKFSTSCVKLSHSKVGHYVKTDIAMPHLTCLGKILTELCQKMTYSWKRMTELCPNDIIALIDDFTLSKLCFWSEMPFLSQSIPFLSHSSPLVSSRSFKYLIHSHRRSVCFAFAFPIWSVSWVMSCQLSGLPVVTCRLCEKRWGYRYV